MGLARSRATWGPKVANTFLKKQQRKLAREGTRLLNEMEEKAKEYEEEAIAREERLMMQVEDHRGNQQDQERRYLATERTLRMPGYVAKGVCGQEAQRACVQVCHQRDEQYNCDATSEPIRTTATDSRARRAWHKDEWALERCCGNWLLAR